MSALFSPFSVTAQQVENNSVAVSKAKVISIDKVSTREPSEFETTTNIQTITVEVLKGENSGKFVSFENDYIQLKEGDVFYLSTSYEDDGSVIYSVEDFDRLPVLYVLLAIFVLLIALIGRKQGLRGFVALCGSFILIIYALIPGVLAGYSPLLVVGGVSALIIILGSYITHGFNKTTTSAVVGMLATVVVTGTIGYLAVHFARFDGFGTEDAFFLSMNMKGSINMVELLLGGILIGLLGILYDVSIGQSVAVDELHSIAPNVGKKDIFKRAMRIGREHIGALVDTLAIAYVGASLPLLLLFYQSSADVALIVNRELFSAEIIRILIGSIGLILAVPITTALSVILLVKVKSGVGLIDEQKEKQELEKYTHHH